MKLLCGLLAVCTVLLTFVPVMGADKVVVIPMGGSQQSAGSAFIPVYDSDDTFVGFHVAGDYPHDNYSIVSSTGYFTRMNNLGMYMLEFEPVYSSPTCSGSPLMNYDVNDFSIFSNNGMDGVVGKATTGSAIYYIPKNSTPQFLNPAYTLISQDCIARTAGPAPNAYAALPNDPAVTGFNNSYQMLLKAVFTLPPVP